jgi:hypothetical protein
LLLSRGATRAPDPGRPNFPSATAALMARLWANGEGGFMPETTVHAEAKSA